MKAVIQKECGRPSRSHFASWSSLATSPLYHSPRVGQIQEISSPPGECVQVRGTRAS